ncbi:nascent polypeptide-associated complex protein [Candidatus Woesearchaeota archaeon]|jgi:nascent polypeptide-associated complex subunit alpha|nr:nascent polypeptide-associated complex protein [Candidatus Woesearchaeota archaeon]|tara:strand:+ start:2616 stop:2957 length:342 start_codon:yes stop_codon:yes gene_type:complete
MFPGMNPRKMQQMMKRMGIAQVEVPANEVIIKQDDKEIVISDPQVSKVNMMGQETFQVVGTINERAISTTPEINEDDIKTVMEQTGADKEKVKEVLEETKGDLAEAIIKLKEE